jgi:uncharacterized membrane protein YeaQ/YmgE (transglycosylase-associated protein family)
VPILFIFDPSIQSLWIFLALEPQAAYSFNIQLLIFSSHFSLLLGYSIITKSKIASFISLKTKCTENQQAKIIYYCFAVFSVIFLVYAYGHGGIIDLAITGSLIRSGKHNAGNFGYLSYFAIGIKFFHIFFYSFLLNAKNKKAKLRMLPVFFISVIFSIAFNLGTGGRANTGFSIIMLYMLWQNCQKKAINAKSILLASMIFLFSLFMIHYGRSAITALTAFKTNASYIETFEAHSEAYLKQKIKQDSIFVSIVLLFKRFDYKFASIYPALSCPEKYDAPRLFLDYPRAILGLIPGEKMPDVFVSSRPPKINQQYFSQLSNTNFGYVPMGWIALNLINGGIAWAIFGAFIAGVLGAIINKIVSRNLNNSPFMPGFAIFLAFFWKNYLIAEEAKELVFNNLYLILFVFTFFKIFHVKVKKN